MKRTTLARGLILCLVASQGLAAPPAGYFRQPAIHGDTVVFLAEGDLWKVKVSGGAATRLTSHPGDEVSPAISPDGKTIAFVGGRMAVVGWTPSGRIIAMTDVLSTLPNAQLVTITPPAADAPDSASPAREVIPLAQAADGCYDDSGKTLFFTRQRFQGSHTKRYKGGTAQQIWKFTDGSGEAVPLTADFDGTSKRPMFHGGRVYFASDRDGTMNLWSMTPEGKDLKQHTTHDGWDVASPSLDGDRIVYQLGADLHVFEISSGKDSLIPVTIDSDFDQTRERWIEKPASYLSAVHVSPDGDRAVITARGRVFVAPHRQGRLVEATRKEGVRYRDARFMPDGKSLLALSDESGEVELWKLPVNGVGKAEQLTSDGDVLRGETLPSPDGTQIAHTDKNQRLFIFDVETKTNRKVDESMYDMFSDLRWSPDSKWLAYAAASDNQFRQVKVYSIDSGVSTAVTTNRYDSSNPAWSPDGKWLYLISDRNLTSAVSSPWGFYAPEPYLDKTSKIYMISLKAGTRSPFAPKDEVQQAKEEREKLEKEKKEKEEKDKKEPVKEGDGKAISPSPAEKTPVPLTPPDTKTEVKADGKPADAAGGKKDDGKGGKKDAVKVEIDLEGIAARIREVPVGPGTYAGLTVNDKALFWVSTPAGDRKQTLMGLAIANENIEPKVVLADIRSYEMSADGKKLLATKGDTPYIFDAAPAPADLDKKAVELGGWTLSVVPREEWRQMFDEAWRLERDYFYDRNMHGVDWKAMREKYRPLVDRVSSRDELSDLLAKMVSELSALHIFVNGGDMRDGPDRITPASLGARLVRDEKAGGYRVEHVFLSDPDEPERTSPLARPGVEVRDGDVILAVNGVETLSVPDIALLLREKAGRQVLLRVRGAASADKASPDKAAGDAAAAGSAERDVVVVPMSPGSAADLRYHEWEYTRRLETEEMSKGEIGYVHLRAMGQENWTEFAKAFYPVYNRQGLIIDVRHNRGGNIDSWVIEKLLRKAWFTWSQRIGQPANWNMQYAFQGHVVVLCDEWTASDGEAFSEGVKQLKLGTVIGTRTWGGEIWLSSSNFLVDRGIATAAEFGVFGPEGTWLIEGRGVEPDITVDNLPHATFKGEDAQLKAAVEHLRKQIQEKPVKMPVTPKFPDKSFKKPGK